MPNRYGIPLPPVPPACKARFQHAHFRGLRRHPWVRTLTAHPGPIPNTAFKSQYPALDKLYCLRFSTADLTFTEWDWSTAGPGSKSVSSILKMAVPVRYMLFPPTMPEREEMLYGDEKGVRMIKREWKKSGEDPGDWGLWALVVISVLLKLISRISIQQR